MKNKLFTVVVTVGLLAGVRSVVAQDSVTISTTSVADNIYLLNGKGGNIGLFVGDDGSFIIDDQYAPLTEKILEAIKAVGGDTPKFLINTHFHGDHTGGNENMGNKGALIVSHDNVRQRLEDGSFIKAFNLKSSVGKIIVLLSG